MSPTLAASIIKVASIAMIGAALILATGAFTSISTPAIWFLDFLDWPFDGQPGELDRIDQWLCGVAGGLLIGFACMFLFVVAPRLAVGDQQARRGALIALVLWFVVDCAGSIAAGVTSNAVINTLLAIPFAVPLLMMKSDR